MPGGLHGQISKKLLTNLKHTNKAYRGQRYHPACKIVKDKLLKYGLDEQTVGWTENCLNHWSQW